MIQSFSHLFRLVDEFVQINFIISRKKYTFYHKILRWWKWDWCKRKCGGNDFDYPSYVFQIGKVIPSLHFFPSFSVSNFNCVHSSGFQLRFTNVIWLYFHSFKANFKIHIVSLNTNLIISITIKFTIFWDAKRVLWKIKVVSIFYYKIYKKMKNKYPKK